MENEKIKEKIKEILNTHFLNNILVRDNNDRKSTENIKYFIVYDRTTQEDVHECVIRIFRDCNVFRKKQFEIINDNFYFVSEINGVHITGTVFKIKNKRFFSKSVRDSLTPYRGKKK